MKLSELQEQLSYAKSHYRSILTVVCKDCKLFVEFKDGKGKEGIVSDGLCPACGAIRRHQIDENAVIGDSMRDYWANLGYTD